MNKILQNLSNSGDITQLLEFLDNNHPEILKESINSQQKENSFFIHFAYGIKQNYEKIKYFYELNKKYGYEFKNSFNKNSTAVDELETVLKAVNYNEDFILDCLKDLSVEERIKICIKTDLLTSAFKNEDIEIIKELQKYPELWKDEKKIQYIKNNNLTNLKLTELFYQNVQEDDLIEIRKKCIQFIENNLRGLEAYHVNYTVGKINEFLKDMSQKEGLFIQEFKEQLVGISIQCPQIRAINAIIKTLFNETIATYKPETPLWIYFDKLNNKDILYGFLNKFKPNDVWEDTNGVKHYKIDYLEKGLDSMKVQVDTEPYRQKSNTEKRDVAISKKIKEMLKDYWEQKIEGVSGVAREIIKKSSRFISLIDLEVPKDKEDIKVFLDKTLLFKKDDKYVVLERMNSSMGKFKGVERIFERDILTPEELIIILKKYPTYDFNKSALDVFKERVIDNKLIIELESFNLERMSPHEKNFFQDIETIISYNKMQKKFEDNPSVNNETTEKIKKAKI